ncbi:MAG: hypothetical protein ACLR0N_00835 [Bilophila wadsworthia]
MTTATDTFRQHLQETQAIHFLPYVGDGYADARPRILMIGEANHGTAPDGADRTYTDGVVRRALQDAAEGNGNHWVRYIRNISAMLTGNAYGGSNAVWDTVAYGVFFQHMETETHRNRSRATPEEIALGRGAFFAMLDVLKPDFVIVWGLTLFKQHWLSPESGITMLAPASARMSSQIARMSVSGTATTRRGFQPCFRTPEMGGRPETAYPLIPLPVLFRFPLRVRMPPPGWGPAL